MTTDIKSRLSDLGKQWKEKLTAKTKAEEAEEASSAESAVLPAEEAASEAAVSQDTVQETESGSEALPADTASLEESGSDESHKDETPAQTPPEEENRRITDEALAEVLLAFGWHVPEGKEEADPAYLPGSSQYSPALDELAAEVTAVMEEFVGETVSVYEEETQALPVNAGEAAASTVSQDTHVFPAIGTAEEENPAESEEAAKAGESLTEHKPSDEAADALEESEKAEEQPIDAKELFSGMNQEILKEVFSEEELSALEGDATHVFKKEEIEDLTDQQKQAEENRKEKEKPDRRRTKRTAEKQETEKSEKKRASARPAEPAYTARDYRPIRRKRSYRSGLRGGLMYFGFVICVSVILASVAWLAADDVLSLNKDYVEAEVYVGEKLDMKQLSTELYNKGLIKYPQLFRIFAKLMKAETKVEPGVYTLSSKLDYNAMVHAMHQSESGFEERATVKVTIPEGKTLKQTFQILAEHGVCPYETLLECAANYEFKYEFLTDIPYGSDTRLEGYLFPDTYEFYAPSDPEEAIEKFLDNFNSKFSAEMRLIAGESGYSLHEIVTVASLIEMEAGKDAERATIASVIYNRLNSSYYPYLQIDATIQYALEERKESLTNADLQIDSPYNTYKYTGLPPGPIANPGLASIRAALEPESTGYYFYALNKSGSHNFFATQSQFEYFVNSSEFGG